MAPEPVVQVKGADRLVDTLKASAEQLADLQRAHEAVGAMVSSAARGLAPKRSGALAASVAATVAVAGVDVGADTPYAGVIHWGWPAHNIAAQPFIEKAIEGTQAQSEQIYLTEVDDILSKVEGDTAA